MMKKLLVFLCAVLVFGATMASATIIEYNVIGTVTHVDAPITSVVVGDSYVLNFAVDDSVPDSNRSPTFGRYINAVSYTFDIGGGAYVVTDVADLVVENTESYDRIRIQQFQGGQSLDGETAREFRPINIQGGPDLLDTDAIPTPILLSIFNSTDFDFQLVFEPFRDGPQVTGRLNIMTPVPEPPIAETGPDQIVFDEVTLDGSLSSDPDSEIVLHEWYLQHREDSANDRTAEGDVITISDLEPGFYDVTLTVTDNDGLTGSDTMLLAVADSESIDELQALLVQKDQTIIDLKLLIIQKDNTIADLNAQIAQNEQTINSLVATLLKKSNADANAANAVKILAQKAIDQAVTESGKAKEIDKALKEMVKAQKELDHTKKDGTPDPKYDKAIDHYKKAWKDAQKAIK